MRLHVLGGFSVRPQPPIIAWVWNWLYRMSHPAYFFCSFYTFQYKKNLLHQAYADYLAAYCKIIFKYDGHYYSHFYFKSNTLHIIAILGSLPHFINSTCGQLKTVLKSSVILRRLRISSKLKEMVQCDFLSLIVEGKCYLSLSFGIFSSAIVIICRLQFSQIKNVENFIFKQNGTNIFT